MFVRRTSRGEQMVALSDDIHRVGNERRRAVRAPSSRFLYVAACYRTEPRRAKFTTASKMTAPTNETRSEVRSKSF